MKLVLSLVAEDEYFLDAQIAFHLNAGVDLVLVAHRSAGDADEVLGFYEHEGLLRRVEPPAGADDAACRTALARLAADELEADWLVDCGPGEFWLPRGESLVDVLVAIPPRYGLVQALVREFVPRPEDDRPFFERMTVRRAAIPDDDGGQGRLERALRPLYRARSDVVVGVDRETALDGRVPLRAWYPIEVLTFPRHASPALGEAEVAEGLEAGTLVRDERLRDALAQLLAPGDARRSPGGFALPEDDVGRLGLRTPTVVDDVAYAVECAALKEVDFEPLVARIAELEQRIGSLEASFWPRLRRRLSRLRPR